MKRSRAFILSEQLLAILLQAGFILVLCMSFYLLTTFYAQSQQIMTARNHAERVISFVDNKIRYAGLGLWGCRSPEEIGTTLKEIGMLSFTYKLGRAYKLPISLKWLKDGKEEVPLNDAAQEEGDMLTLLYAQKDLSSGGSEVVSAFSEAKKIKWESSSTYLEAANIKLLDKNDGRDNLVNNSIFSFKKNNEKDIKRYALMESVGFPMYLKKVSEMRVTLLVYVPNLLSPSREEITIPAGGELMGLNCMQMFVHGTDGVDEGRQFAYRELTKDGIGWKDTYNQEKNILDIYMKRDKDNNTFTLWVLATGGYDANLNTERPETWPKEANPQGDTDDEAQEAWRNHDYRHHIVYVSRASWKLNNLENFNWGDDD